MYSFIDNWSQAVTPSRVYGKCQSLMYRLSKDGRKALVEYPTAQAKTAFRAMGYEIPSEVRLADFAAMVLGGKREEEAKKPKRGEEESPSPELRACSVEFVAHARFKD